MFQSPCFGVCPRILNSGCIRHDRSAPFPASLILNSAVSPNLSFHCVVFILQTVKDGRSVGGGGRGGSSREKGVIPERIKAGSTLFLHALGWVQKNFSVRTAVAAIHCVSYDFRRDFVDFWIIHVSTERPYQWLHTGLMTLCLELTLLLEKI